MYKQCLHVVFIVAWEIEFASRAHVLLIFKLYFRPLLPSCFANFDETLHREFSIRVMVAQNEQTVMK